MHRLLSKIFPKAAYISLMLKMFIITLLLGIAIWLTLDKIQTEYLNKYFISELDTRLSQQARLDKFLFSKYITLFKHTSRQITSLKSFSDYLSSDLWLKPPTNEIKEYKRQPKWFPKRSVMRSLALPDYAMLIDSSGKVRERYMRKDHKLPDDLKDPSKHLVQVTHNQSYITLIEGTPYVLSSESIFSDDGSLTAYLLLISAIDNHLLETSQQSIVSSSIVVLLSADEPVTVIASSRQDILPAGTSLQSLQQEYRITDLEFIEYGGSDFRVKFVSLLPYEEVNKLTGNINDAIRVNILVSSIIFVSAFSLLILYITRKIKNLTKYVTAFEIDELKRHPSAVKYHDELYVLKYRFTKLIEEVMESRKDLQSESKELKAINEALDKANEELQQAVAEHVKAKKEKEHIWHQLLQSQKMESVGRLTGGVAHDFNNLLGGIVGYAQLIRDMRIDNDDLSDFVNIIIQAGNKASILINQLLAFSRKQALDIKVININTLIENLSKMLVRVIGEDIKLELDLSDNNLAVNADSTQFEQVLINLAVNARHAMPQGGTLTIVTNEELLEGDTSLNGDEEISGRYVTISVKDTGHGIPEEIQEKIFEPFFTTKEKGEGTGLGLSTVFGVVKQHEGFIKLQSEVGIGTELKIYLLKAKGVEHRDIPVKKEELKGGNETILLVDDEQIIRGLIDKSLSFLGYNIITAASGEKALKLFDDSDNKIDLLITDVIMTGINGYELYKMIASKDPGMQVIFISGYVENKILSENIHKNNHVLLTKPIDIKEMTDTIRELMDKK